MKQEDIDRLREICEKEGFQVSTFVMDKSLFEITTKDPWEGVEFFWDHTNGKVYKTSNRSIQSEFFNLTSPAKEAEYVEQLKREAFERYGEIKDGDKFQFYGKGFHSIKLSDTPDLDYFKEFDELSLWGFPLYKQGKWAKKQGKRVEVEINDRVWRDISNGSYDFGFDFNVKNGGTNININDCAAFLASQLEKYLNNEINE